jgi:hypothetical protein
MFSPLLLEMLVQVQSHEIIADARQRRIASGTLARPAAPGQVRNSSRSLVLRVRGIICGLVNTSATRRASVGPTSRA